MLISTSKQGNLGQELQLTTTPCNTLQHTATHCNTHALISSSKQGNPGQEIWGIQTPKIEVFTRFLFFARSLPLWLSFSLSHPLLSRPRVPSPYSSLLHTRFLSHPLSPSALHLFLQLCLSLSCSHAFSLSLVRADALPRSTTQMRAVQTLQILVSENIMACFKRHRKMT